MPLIDNYNTLTKFFDFTNKQNRVKDLKPIWTITKKFKNTPDQKLQYKKEITKTKHPLLRLFRRWVRNLMVELLSERGSEVEEEEISKTNINCLLSERGNLGKPSRMKVIIFSDRAVIMVLWYGVGPV